MSNHLLTVVNATSLADASKTSAEQGSDDREAKALIFVFDLTGLAGGGTLQLIVEYVDSVSGKFISFGTFASVAAPGTYCYNIGVGLTGGGGDGITSSRVVPVPPRWRARIGGSGTITDADYTLSVSTQK